MIKISDNAKLIKPSPTLSISKLAKQMVNEGLNVINFGVGEPDFNTPEYIKNSGKKAIDNNFTKYTAVSGISELKDAICTKFKNENNIDYSPENILVSPGAKASIINILLAVCNPDDEIIISSPYWVSYTSQIAIARGKAAIIETTEKNDFKFTADDLEKKIKECKSPKALLLNSPSNPTGVVYSKEELLEIANVCLKHNILIISDEIYEKLVYDEIKHISIASLSQKIADNTVIVNGVSKAYAMTGWRLGYIAGPKTIIGAATRLQAHMTSCVNSIAQKAAVSALMEDDGTVEKMRQTFEKRRNKLVDLVSEIKNVSCIKPDGAFYVMINVGHFIENNNKEIKNSVELCEYLLKDHLIAIVPGAAFGNDNYVRFSYANSMENIKEGLKRFDKGLKDISCQA